MSFTLHLYLTPKIAIASQVEELTFLDLWQILNIATEKSIILRCKFFL